MRDQTHHAGSQTCGSAHFRAVDTVLKSSVCLMLCLAEHHRRLQTDSLFIRVQGNMFSSNLDLHASIRFSWGTRHFFLFLRLQTHVVRPSACTAA